MAVKAFAEMLPVFRHDRCSNCHGGMDMFSGAHPGADQLDEKLNPRTLPMTKEFVGKFENQCKDCHDGLRGWTVTPPSLFFVDKDDEKLCMQMKGFGNDTGAKFVSHIQNDHGGIQFIAAGFAGDRALGKQGLKDHGLVAQPPPGTQLQLEARARNWVAWMGGNWVGDPACGCVMPKIEGTFTQIDSAPLGNILGSGTDAQKISGTAVFAPVDDEPAAPSFGNVKSSFFQASTGTITVEFNQEFQGLAGSRCAHRGRKSFAVADLPPRLRRYLWLELAEDGRYRLSLGLPDRIWQIWKMDVESVCTFPTGHVVRERLPVNQVALILGVHEGKLSAEDGIEGRLAAPIRQGPRSIDGNWSFAGKPSQ